MYMYIYIHTHTQLSKKDQTHTPTHTHTHSLSPSLSLIHSFQRRVRHGVGPVRLGSQRERRGAVDSKRTHSIVREHIL